MTITTRAKNVFAGDRLVVRVKEDGKRIKKTVVVNKIMRHETPLLTFVFDGIKNREYRPRHRVEINGNLFDEPKTKIDDVMPEWERALLSPTNIDWKIIDTDSMSRDACVLAAADNGMKTNTKTTKKAAVEFLVNL